MTSSPALPGIRLTRDAPDGWRELLHASGHATFFQDDRWVSLYARHHGGEPCYLYAEADGGLAGGLVAVRFRRGIFHFYESLPLGTYGGPVTCEGALRGPLDRALVERLVRLGAHPLCVRVQCVMRRHAPGAHLDRFDDAPLFVVPLGDSFEVFWREIFPRNRRNECTRAIKRGVTVDTSATHADIEAYYPLDLAAHSRWGLRPHPEAFFHDLVEMESDDLRIFVVRHEGQLLGLHVSLVSQDELIAWHGVTSRVGSKRYFPTSMLVRAEAQFAAERGLASINMGASEAGAGIANFKKLLGGATTTTRRYERNHPLLPLAKRLRRAH